MPACRRSLDERLPELVPSLARGAADEYDVRMKGDIIIVEEHHRRVAGEIVTHFLDRISRAEQPYTISVAGESGSGKSETASAIRDELEDRSIRTFIFQQDDYFVLPPRSNDRRRREDVSWVGTQEVRLDLLDHHLGMAREGEVHFTKPLVDYEGDRVGSEEIDLTGFKVLIAEGTYTTLLENIETRVFIARNRIQTLESRIKRGREPIEPFIERILEIEHELIAPHRDRADVIISKDYAVSVVAP
jgi:uridine kinase